MKIQQLVKDVFTGKTKVSDLSPEDAELVLHGFQQIAENLLSNPDTKEAGQAILQVIASAEMEESFDAAVALAEDRGSTYWELETNRIH